MNQVDSLKCKRNAIQGGWEAYIKINNTDWGTTEMQLHNFLRMLQNIISPFFSFLGGGGGQQQICIYE
jgi:hypothetical protein